MNFRSYKDLLFDIRTKLLPKLTMPIKAVYGIARSGMTPAYMLANELGVPAGVAGGFAFSGNRITKTVGVETFGINLLIDDSLYTGTSFEQGEILLRTRIREPYLKACVYVSEEKKHLLDFYAEVLPGPRVFEWNMLNCAMTEKMCFDIDGVLCLDPPMFDDDGVAYQDYIANAIPYMLPRRRVHSICTSRIERWRKTTEMWLNRHGIIYDTLIMHPAKTAQERRDNVDSNARKGAWFQASGAMLFVESHDCNAGLISMYGGNKCVISAESMKVFKYGEK